MLTAISDGMVALSKELTGPTRAKSCYEDDFRGACPARRHSQVGQTPLEGGRGTAVVHQLLECRALMGARFEVVIERASGRPRDRLMRATSQRADMMREVVILAPNRSRRPS